MEGEFRVAVLPDAANDWTRCGRVRKTAARGRDAERKRRERFAGKSRNMIAALHNDSRCAQYRRLVSRLSTRLLGSTRCSLPPSHRRR